MSVTGKVMRALAGGIVVAAALSFTALRLGSLPWSLRGAYVTLALFGLGGGVVLVIAGVRTLARGLKMMRTGEVIQTRISLRAIRVGALAFLGYLLSIYLLGLAVGFRFISVIFNVVERYGELTKPAQTIGLALSAGLLVGGALWVHWWAARAEREFRRDMGEVMR